MSPFNLNFSSHGPRACSKKGVSLISFLINIIDNPEVSNARYSTHNPKSVALTTLPRLTKLQYMHTYFKKIAIIIVNLIVILF